MDKSIQDILDNSDKAEIIEKIGEVLGGEGNRVVIITGIPTEKRQC